MRKKAKKDGRKRTNISLKFARTSAVFRIGFAYKFAAFYIFVKKLLTFFG